MKTVEELRKFFNTELQADLHEIEGKRKKVVNKVYILIAGMTFVFCLGSYIVLNSIKELAEALGFIALFAVVIPALTYMFYKDATSNKDFYNQFKTKVIERIVKFIDPSFIYISHKCIESRDFIDSKIFSETPKRYKGDDYVVGKISPHTRIQFSELHTESKMQVDVKGEKVNKWNNVFKGLFFVADYGPGFKAETVILPRTHNVSNTKTANGPNGNPYNTGNQEFDNIFRVLSTNPQETEKILDIRLIESLIDFHRGSKTDIYCSFVHNRISVAVSHIKDLFEPEIFHTLLDFKIIEEYYDDLYKAISIMEKINPEIKIGNHTPQATPTAVKA